VIELLAHAKLTVSMRITGVRDDGYHLLDAEMISLDLADVIRIDPKGDGIAVSGRYRRGVPTDGRNLVAKALRAAGRTARVTIEKRIPHGGGLGGGSTDAAAILAWAGIDDPDEAIRLGADIPFCLVGGRARVQGIGEVVTPLPFEARDVTLIVTRLHTSTPAVYRKWDELGGPTGEGPNDLEPAALEVEPRLRAWRDRIEDLCGIAPVLAGSGATWWVEGTRDDALVELVDEGATIVPARAVQPVRGS
jgi:4-diphosphocytidyl-2-C-methyl-D-erythritol kinase